MPKRPPFDTNLHFPPAPTRALLSTPLDGIIGGVTPRPEPPAQPAREVPHEEPVQAPMEPSTQASAQTPSRPAPAAGESAPPPSIARSATAVVDASPRDLAMSAERIEQADDGKVTVKLPPDLKNRLYNAIYSERATVGDYLTRAVEDLMEDLERDRGGPYPQRPPADVKFRAGRRPR